MNTKHHVSKTIAKQLAEAGIVIGSEYAWVGFINNNGGEYFEVKHERDSYHPRYPAPIATEILEWFPRGYDFGFELIKLGKGYGAICKDYRVMPYERIGFTKDDNAPNALALLLIRLTKDGLI